MTEEDQPNSQHPSMRWQRMDLALASTFFITTVLLLPSGVLFFMGLFHRNLRVQDLTGLEQILIQALMDLVVVGFVVFLITVVHGWPLREAIGWYRRRDVSTGWLIAAGAFLAISVMIVSAFLPTPDDSALASLLSTTPSLVAFVIFGIALAPFLEEVLFRGFLYAALSDVYGSRVSIPITSLLFGALHIAQLRGNWPAAILILVVGFVLTTVRHRTGSLIPSVIMHTAYNGMIFGVAALSTVVERTAGK